MCNVGDLIDLTEWDEPSKEETIIEEPSNSFKGAFDPFDSVEKEACIKGTLETQRKEKLNQTANHYPDLNNESPPVCMQPDTGATGEAGRLRGCSSSSFQKQLLKVNASRLVGAEDTFHLERTIIHENLQMLAAESPLKLVEDDVLSCSAKFEADLKMLRIPMLDAMTSSVTKSTAETPPDHETPRSTRAQENPSKPIEETGTRDLSQILQQLKAIVRQKVKEADWPQFDSLIASISQAIFGSNVTSCSEASARADETNQTTPLPHAYTRQGTFDLELQKKKSEECASVQPGSEMQDFPDAMVCSAATFDGESRLDPLDKHSIPSIPPLLPVAPVAKKEPYMTELVDESLALQISELLERHNLGKSTIGVHDQHGADPRTVILLLNPSSSSGQQFQIPSSCAVQQDPVPAGILNDSRSMRRRSSSLSIPDKTHLVKEAVKSDRQLENLQNVPPRETRSAVATVAPSSSMSSFRQRCNSFSTPGNPAPKAVADNRRSQFGSRMKTPSITENHCAVKAVIPVKRVVPTVKPLTTCNEGNYLRAPTPRCNVPETPSTTRTKAGQKVFCTSTPLPQMRTQPRRSLKPTGGLQLPNSSFSTPSIRRASFSKKTGSG